MPAQVIDLFCGVGGLTRGLLDAGLNVIAGFDIDPTCQFTYEQNNHVDYNVRNIRETVFGRLPLPRYCTDRSLKQSPSLSVKQSYLLDLEL